MNISFTLPGTPRTKKNSSRIITNRKTGKPIVLPSEQFAKYQDAVGWHIPCKHKYITERINLKCVYYMPTRRKVDLANLLEATCDILVHYGVLDDDNSDIVARHDGSEVLLDRENPRVKITILSMDEFADMEGHEHEL